MRKRKTWLCAMVLACATAVGAEGVRSISAVGTNVVQIRMTNLSHPAAFDFGNKVFDCEILNEDTSDALIYDSQEATGFSTSASGLTTPSWEAPTKNEVVRLAPTASAQIRQSFSAWIAGVIVQPLGNPLTAVTVTCVE